MDWRTAPLILKQVNLRVHQAGQWKAKPLQCAGLQRVTNQRVKLLAHQTRNRKAEPLQGQGIHLVRSRRKPLRGKFRGGIRPRGPAPRFTPSFTMHTCRGRLRKERWYTWGKWQRQGGAQGKKMKVSGIIMDLQVVSKCFSEC
jgi:hypothetical protein